MRFLTTADYHAEAEPLLRNVFLSNNPRNPRFGPKAELKKLLYEYLTPDPQVVETLIQVASTSGDQGFYLSVLVDQGKNFSHWWIPFEEVSLYFSSDPDIFQYANHFETVIYSSQGNWGLMSSFEHFGILAGVHDFVSQVCPKLPGIEEQIEGFLSYVSECKKEWGAERVDLGWVPSLLNQLYGSEMAQSLLQTFNLS